MKPVPTSQQDHTLLPLTSRRAVLGGGLGMTLAALTSEATGRGLKPWPAGYRGAVSITYDDGLDSQLDLAVPALDALGIKATFFITMKNIQHRLGEWAALAATGHELADHTVSHACDLRRYTAREFIEKQIAPMEAWLRSVDPDRSNPAYAYPCDVTDLGPGSPNVQAHRYARLLARAGVVAARTSEGDPNNPARLRQRAYRLQALAVGYDAPDLETVENYLSLAERRGHWAILVFHEIKTNGLQEGDVSQAMHDRIIEAVGKSLLWPATMKEVLSHSL